MFLHLKLRKVLLRAREMVWEYTAAKQPTGRCRVKPNGRKGQAEVIGEGVFIYRDAVPKTGSRLTKQEITRRFRKMSRAPRRKGSAGS